MATHKKVNRLVEFLNGKGFYIILVICIAAVGISGYVLFLSGGGGQDTLMSVPSASPVVAPPSITPVPSPTRQPLTTEIPSGALNSGEVVMSTASPAPTARPTVTTDQPSNATQVAGSAEELEPARRPTASFYVWPLGGEVMVPFSVDELVFSNTMEDWRVHTGADIAGSLGTLVRAIGAGVVEDVYDDEMMGTTVVIDHGNSTRSVYKNLASTVAVAIGDEVEPGQTIGAVGRTADAESVDSPHLHLEVIKAGAQIDPLDLLP